ncbi:uncharacterized protein N7503_007753 [Penicillium pulvis]|uniref:uncharacterized protein n=1 Tax=Penicillium pulvis TaxID=1562058 RepID=UPI00254910CF|nr:uncharacterized protein N7503_007753 [Penicillium pulvis]KAJ5798457.1 hypothetical protein N7503_007753 [Penicillium pulvis]
MSPAGIYEYTETSNDLRQRQAAPRQEEQWSIFDPASLNSLNPLDAPAAPWFQEEYINPQYTDTPFSATGPRTSMHTAQLAAHQEVYSQPTSFDFTSAQEQTLQDRHALSTDATLRHPQAAVTPRKEVIKCHWRGCQYTGTFGRKKDLLRHLETQHVSPMAYKCSFPGCTREYNRDDNLQGHLRRDHGLNGLSR